MSAGLQFIELALVMAVMAHARACVSSPKTDGGEPAHRVRLLPWIEVNRAGGVELDRAVAGLQIWQQVTDTAIVSTVPGETGLYGLLRARVPNMQLIPGIKTHSLLNRFDSREGWRAVSREVQAAVSATGATEVVLENETALRAFWKGEYELDWNLLREGLQALPGDVTYLWFPGIVGHSEAVQARFERVCAVAAEVLPIHFVDRSLEGPDALNDDFLRRAKQKLQKLSSRPPIPILYCYGDARWWRDEQIPQALQHVEGDRVILYPGAKYWVESAKTIVDLLRQGAPEPGRGDGARNLQPVGP